MRIQRLGLVGVLSLVVLVAAGCAGSRGGTVLVGGAEDGAAGTEVVAGICAEGATECEDTVVSDPDCTVSFDGATETVHCLDESPAGDSAGGSSPGFEGTGEILCEDVDKPAPGAPAGTDCSAGPEPEFSPVEPRPGMDDPRPVGWESAETAGRTVTVNWWSGVEPCTVLDRVEVTETPDAVTITLFEGSDPEHPGEACIMIAQAKSTTVELDARVGKRRLVDGAD